MYIFVSSEFLTGKSPASTYVTSALAETLLTRPNVPNRRRLAGQRCTMCDQNARGFGQVFVAIGAQEDFVLAVAAVKDWVRWVGLVYDGPIVET